jgi:hypothetical protein
VLFSVYVNQHANAPEDGVATRVTLPEKPLMLVRLTIVCLSEPTGIVREVALSPMEKFAEAELTVTVSEVDLDRLPLVPVTVMG